MYTALVIDDEADARNVMRNMLKLFCPRITRLVEAADGREAMMMVNNNKFDFAFVDILLNDESGIDLAKRISRHCPNIIFVTAHDRYAVEAFQTQAIHYLLKPVDPELLQQAISKADLPTEDKPRLDNRLFLSTRERMVVLRHEEIEYVAGDGNYADFHDLDGASHYVSRGLTYYEKLIDSARFFRIHQSYLVNLNYVRNVSPVGRRGNFEVTMNSGAKLPLARRRKEKFMKALKGE